MLSGSVSPKVRVPRSSRDSRVPGTLERSPPRPCASSSVFPRDHGSCRAVTHPSPQGPQESSSATRLTLHCSPSLVFRVSRPVSTQAQAWGRCSGDDVLPSWLPQSPRESQKSLPAGWDHSGDAVAHRPYELEENCDTGSPSLQMGKVRTR